MARFDVYRLNGYQDLVLDCQADVLSILPSRFVVPLVSRVEIAQTFGRLNPIFRIDHIEYVMATQSAGTVMVLEFGDRVTSLADEQSAIMNALDMLMTGC